MCECVFCVLCFVLLICPGMGMGQTIVPCVSLVVGICVDTNNGEIARLNGLFVDMGEFTGVAVCVSVSLRVCVCLDVTVWIGLCGCLCGCIGPYESVSV